MLEEEEDTEDLYIHFAGFEEFCKEFERARAIYKYALDHVPKGKADALYGRFVKFEKQHGNRDSIEEVLSAKKRLQVRCGLTFSVPTDITVGSLWDFPQCLGTGAAFRGAVLHL